MRNLLATAALLSTLLTSAQKIVYTHPIELPKGFLYDRTDSDYFILNDDEAGNVFFVFKDHKKVEYALVNNTFKLIEKLQENTSETAFDEKRAEYIGGFVEGNRVHFIYEVKKGKEAHYIKETVDFNTKKRSHDIVLKVPEEEKALFAFSHQNRFHAFTTNDSKSEIVVYSLEKSEKLQRKPIPFKVPETKNKMKNEVSEFLTGVRILKDEEEPGLDLACGAAKLFSSKNKLVLLSNNGADPTHVLQIDLPLLTYTEKSIDHAANLNTEKDKAYINSFYKNGTVLSLILNKKDIQIAAYNATTGSLIKSHEFNAENGVQLVSGNATSEERRGKKTNEKSIEDFKKLIKHLTSGTEGLMAYVNKRGQLVVTVGTYDQIPVSSGGGGSAGHYMPSAPSINQQRMYGNNGPGVVMQYVPPKPGVPSLMNTSANFYKSTYFKILIDPVSFNMTKGRISVSESDQIKDYIDGVDKSRTSYPKQFSVGKKQFYSFYDRDVKAYVVEQIKIIP